MTCDLREKVVLYVDDELESVAQQEVAKHLRLGCPECSMAMIHQTELKKALRLAGKPFSAPPELHAAIRRDLRHNERPAWMVWKWGFVFASLVLLTVVGVLFHPQTKFDPIIGVLVDQHVTALASANPVDVISDNRHNVKPWFQGKVPFTFNMPELAGSSFTLIGGKVVYAGQNPGAELLYEVRSHKISVFIFRTGNPEAKAVSNRGLSFAVNVWTRGELQFHMVSDASQEEAGELIAMFQDANRS
jgi:anti-sigma factor RsiW